jgi:hypothetical protein
MVRSGCCAALAVSDVVVFVRISTSHSTSLEFFVNHLTNLSFSVTFERETEMTLSTSSFFSG